MANMVSRDQMLILLGKISCTTNVSSKTCSTKKAPGSAKERVRGRTTHMIEGNKVCRDTFLYLHSISMDRLTALLKWYKSNGLVCQKKLSGGRCHQKRADRFEDIKQAVAFIANYAEDAGFKRHDAKRLLSCETKIKVYKAYCLAMSQLDFQVMSESVFRDTLIKLTPFILTARPMTDLCWTCQRNNNLMYCSANIAEEEKCSHLRQQEHHLLIVHQERSL
jgi:hypothetical protein